MYESIKRIGIPIRLRQIRTKFVRRIKIKKCTSNLFYMISDHRNEYKVYIMCINKFNILSMVHTYFTITSTKKKNVHNNV